MKRLGVFATEEEIEKIRRAATAPYIKIGDYWPNSAAEVAHECALKHGLPKITGMYGCDLSNGEFLSV